MSASIRALITLGLGVLLFYSSLIDARTTGVGGDFSLTDHNGQHFELKQLRGRVVLAFFGYTHCPDICPTELAGLAQLVRSLGAQKDEIQVLFISVDPIRDTPERLKEYVGFFSKDMIGLGGSEREIEGVKKAYHIQSQVHSRVENDPFYSVDHSANLYVIDQHGTLVNIVPYGFPLSHVEKIVRALLDMS